jgi:hypothetical protein
MFSPLTNTTEIKGKIVVMKLKTPIYIALDGSAWIPLTVGREIQRVGGVGIILKAQEKVCFCPLKYIYMTWNNWSLKGLWGFSPNVVYVEE